MLHSVGCFPRTILGRWVHAHEVHRRRCAEQTLPYYCTVTPFVSILNGLGGLAVRRLTQTKQNKTSSEGNDGFGMGRFLAWWAKAEIMEGGWSRWNFWGWWNFSEQIQISFPNIGGGFCSLWAKAPPKMAAARKLRRAKLSQIFAGTSAHGNALPCANHVLLQPVLLDLGSSSFCCTFSSNFCVAMAKQHCSNPGGTALFKAKFGTTHQKWPQNDQNLGVGSSYGTNKPSSRKPSLPYEFQAVYFCKTPRMFCLEDVQ